MKKIWFDITNTPQVHFLISIQKELNKNADYGFVFTARDFSETVKLLEKKINFPFQVIGRHHGKSTVKKISGLLGRFKDVASSVSEYDVSVSCGSETAIWTSFFRGKHSIAFGDNDKAKQWTYGFIVDYAFFPDAIPAEVLNRQGLKHKKLFRYPGYKEDIYIADYQPDNNFFQTIPFSHYVVVRPENIMANYIHSNDVQTITPELLRELSQKGFNILYLPRYEFDRAYADGLMNVYIPDSPINGLDACYFADAVLTGAGTFAREAACLGVPSFSFYAGNDLLAVDKKMIADGWMYYSRDIADIITKLITSERKEVDLSRSKAVRDEVVGRLQEMINFL